MASSVSDMHLASGIHEGVVFPEKETSGATEAHGIGDMTYCRDAGCDFGDKKETSGESQPIAVVGMGMRLPGDVRTAEDFWSFLMAKKDGAGQVPADRYNVDAFYDPEKQHATKTRQGHFLREDPACFDASFFSMPAIEAEGTDPELRGLFEVIWECLENAGEVDWEGKNIGCFVGTFGEDWLTVLHQDPQAMNRAYALAGGFVLSNAISHRFDWTGPSMTILSACSSSLLCVHEACQNLATGVCDAAVVAGSNLIFTPAMTTTMSDNGVLSESGICRTFDAQADGYGRAEGINALYLKRLDDAIKANDPIRGVIRSTAANSDGKSSSIFAPSSTSQQSLIQQAYRRAGIQDLGETGLFECHGTGTQAGDTAEASALAELLAGKGGILGAAKPNFGHSEGASGITSLIKALLSLEKRTIPPVAHFRTPNPAIPFKDGGLVVPSEAVSWPDGRRERASINGFGIGGANAHVILESVSEFCEHDPSINLVPEKPGKRLLVVSAQSKESLASRIAHIDTYLKENPTQLPDLAYTLGVRRKHLSHRAFAVTDPSSTFETSFEMRRAESSAKVSFVFTGQGAQWAGMGKGLMHVFPKFREDIRQLEKVLDSVADPPSWSLKDELSKEDSSCLSSPELCQPLCTAIQIGLVNLLANWGIRPSYVVGHSSGEIAAAYAAGAISASSAIILAYYRGKFASLLAGSGEMVSLGLSRKDALPYLEEGVVIACENSPNSVTLSGNAEKVNRIAVRIRTDLPDTFCRVLGLNMAYHSPQMKAIGERYVAAIANHIDFNEAMLPMFSSVTMQRIINPADLNASYWQKNLEDPVLFSEAVACVIRDTDRCQIFVEVGPHSALAAPMAQIFRASEPKKPLYYVSSLIRNGTDTQSQLFSMAGNIFMRGGHVNLQAINGMGKVLTDLPLYPWQHKERYWHEGRTATAWRFREFPAHELLGIRCTETTDLAPSWRNLLRLEDVPWLSDHVLQTDVVFPGAGYIAMAGEAIRQTSGGNVDFTVKNVIFHMPLVLEGPNAVEIVTSLTPVKTNDLVHSNWFYFTIMAYQSQGWSRYCSGQVRPGNDDEANFSRPVQYPRPVSSEKWYRALSGMGLEYGSRFRGLQKISADPKGNKASATATLQLNMQSHYAIHPTVIDQSFQLLSVATAAGLPRRITKAAIPASITKLFVGSVASDITVSAEVIMESIGIRGNAKATVGEDVVLQLTQGMFFVLDHDSEPYETQIPLTAQLEWRPDIDSQDAQSLLPRSEARLNGVKDYMRWLEDVVVLYILETAERVRDVHPKTKELSKWKSWIQTQESRIHNGTIKTCPKAKEWATLSSSQRIKSLEDIKLRFEARNDDIIGPYLAVARVFDKCVDILEGSVSSLEIFIEDNLFERFYSFIQPWADWSRFLQLLAHSNPRMRILEIGAGTGSATVEVLKSLERSGKPTFSKYTWTDISPAFLSGGQDKFKSYRNIEYKVLDISCSPKDQGFSTQEYDLIIASNVIHAAPSLHQALIHVRELLAPNGRLLLHELNPDMLYIDYCMGTISGWWIGSQDGRPNAPYVNSERWHTELQSAGFTGIEAEMDDMESPFRASCTMISRIAGPAPEILGITLLTSGPAHCLEPDLEKELAGLGFTIKWSTIHEFPEPNEWIISLLDIERPFLKALTQESFDAIRSYLANADKCKIIWVTKPIHHCCSNPDFGLILGLARTLRQELRLDLATLEVESFDSKAVKALQEIMRKMNREKSSFASGPDYEFCLQGGCLNVGRYFWEQPANTPQSPQVSENAIGLQIGTLGLLNTLEWQEISPRNLGNEDVEIEMHYIGLNFKDVMVAMGFVGTKNEMGLEGSGIVRRVGCHVTGISPGQRVIVIGMGIFQSIAVVNQQACMEIPSGMSLEEAGGMAAIFATAQYSLVYLAQLRKDQTVLIHSACGGVGLASIQICKAIGAQIYVTVGTQEKVDYLTQSLNIPPDRIFDSRSASFKPALMKITNGRGVDVVLNSLAGELLHASWDCVAPFGKFIELGKRDMLTNGMLNLNPFLRNRTFFGVDMNAVLEPNAAPFESVVEQFQLWLKEGKITPIRRTLFEASQAPSAFRTLQMGAHIGKILIKMHESSQDMQVKPLQQAVIFPPDASYLLVGGFGGVGRAVATWLVERGARRLTIFSRSAGISPDDKCFILELEAQGCHVRSVAGDVANPMDVKKAIAACGASLKGVLQMSLCLKDESFLSMTFEQWSTALAPKVQGTWNLHDATLDSPLDFFVVFGSMSGICGREGQANYAAANTFLDAFTVHRRQLGLPASALDLGIVGEVGFVSRNNKLLQSLRGAGIYHLSEADVLSGLEIAILHSQSPFTTNSDALIGTSYLVGAQHTRPLSDPTVRQCWATEARFAPYTHVENFDHGESTTQKTSNIKTLLAQAQNDHSIVYRKETAEIVTQEVSQMVTMYLPDTENMDHEEKLKVQIDSLMAIEVRNWARRNLNVELRMSDIVRANTVGGLADLLVERLKAKFPIDGIESIDFQASLKEAV